MTPEGDNIIDIKKISQLLESYTKATGLVSALLDLEGNILSQSGWQKICTQFHRIHPETAKNCRISDTTLAEQLQDGQKYSMYKCLNGLVDVAVPIIVNGKHMYNLFTGQFFMERPQEAFFEAQADKYGFDKNEYMDALRQVPILKAIEIENKLLFLSQMTEVIVELGLAKEESVKTNIALRESEEKFKALYDNAPLSYQSLNEDGSFKDVNSTWLNTLGYERNEVIDHFYKDFLHPDWQGHFEENFSKFKKCGHINHVEYRMRHKKGHYLDISIEGCIGYHPDGSFKQTYCVFNDITEKNKVEQTVYLSNERYKSLFNDSPIPLWEEDFTEVSSYLLELKEKGIQDLRQFFKNNPDELLKCSTMVEFIDVNQAALELHQADSKEQLIGNVHKIFTNNSFSTFVEELVTIREGNKTFKSEAEIMTLSGELRYINLSLNVDYSQTDRTKVILATPDITDRKQAEKNKQIAEKNLQKTFDISPSIICKANLNTGFFIEVNNAVTNILGYSPDEFKSKPLLEFIHPDDRPVVGDVIAEQLSGKEVVFFENRYLCKDGSYKWMAWNGTKADVDGLVTAIGSDITDRKMVEQELTQYRENLEALVRERTTNLEEKNRELEKFNELFVDREFRIKELRDEIDELKNR